LESEHILKFIENIRFFKSFSEGEKRKLAGSKATFRQFEKDSDIFKEGDSGTSLFVVLVGNISLIKLSEADVEEGRVSLKSSRERNVGELGVGAVFGEISLLTGRRRSVTARVVSTKVVVMEITNKLIDSLIPSIQTKIHKQLLLELVNVLDDMDTRYLKLRNELDLSKQPD